MQKLSAVFVLRFFVSKIKVWLLCCCYCYVKLYEIKVAMKLAPDRKKFMEVMGGSGNINGEMEKFCTTFSPILQEIHKFLVRSKLSSSFNHHHANKCSGYIVNYDLRCAYC